MKKAIILFTIVTCMCAACSKKKDETNSSGNTWTFAGKNYKAATVVYINANGTANLSATATGATSTSANGLTFSFINSPTANGQMLITNSGASNTVMVVASNLTGTNTTFYSNDVTNVNANITLNGGKVAVSFPGTISLHNLANYNDSAQISAGTITQQ